VPADGAKAESAIASARQIDFAFRNRMEG